MMEEEQGVRDYEDPCVEEAAKVLQQGELVLGSLVGFDDNGKPLVSYSVNQLSSKSKVAEATLSLLPAQVGRQVAIMFMQQNENKPVIIGLIHNPLLTVLETEQAEARDNLSIEVDGEPQDRVSVEGKEEVVLRCGDASITLTKEGKILLRGKYLVSRSSGVNRILGGSVQVN